MRIKRYLTRLYGSRLAWTVIAVLSLLMFTTIGQAQPTNFVNITNHEIRWSGTGIFDWANGPNSAGAITTSNTGVVNAPGTNGLFDGGVFNGQTTPPTPPTLTAAALANTEIPDADFIADPLSGDVTNCGTGDPTVYTGAGSEVNGELFSGMTWGTGSVPNKDDLANVYAVAHRSATAYEIFFGAERVINNGDSHIDFEFLQAKNIAKVGNCSGSFTGDRSQGDLLVAVDFTSGGTLGDTKLYVWNCLAQGVTQPITGTVCNPPLHGKSVPHYQQIGSQFVVFGVNSQGDIQGGGWASRNADGTQTTTIATNEFMEGGIDLNKLNFSGCVNTFLPHTRSSQSFTAVLKDFAGPIDFETCVNPAITTNLVGVEPQRDVQSGASITVTVGSVVTDTATLVGATASATGTVTYTVYLDNACTQVHQSAGVKNVTGGVVPPSDPITFNSVGVFYWQAVYSGDIQFGGQNRAATSDCTAEVLTVINPSTILTKSAAIVASVTYTYTEQNDGSVALTNPSVTDDKCSPVVQVVNASGPNAGKNIGDADGDGVLDTSETWTFKCTQTLTLTAAGTISQTNTAIGTGTDPLGHPVTFCAPGPQPVGTVCDADERKQETVSIKIGQ
ncbi:MAG: hypothetical protein HYX94_12790 [Chloroflexi bacterium]|nr:hypothetical protein [Chloroflexota bacterium]